MAVLDDIKTSKGYVLGVIAFATAVGTFLTTVCKFRAEPTVTAVATVVGVILFISWLIDRSEKRQEVKLKTYQDGVKEKLAVYDDTLKELVDYTKETQLATLRIEMDNEITRNPSNHDTILKYAEKYFIKLGGDWVQTDKFLMWVESENANNRPVYVPPHLMSAVTVAKSNEK